MCNPYHVSEVKNLQNCGNAEQMRVTLFFMMRYINYLIIIAADAIYLSGVVKHVFFIVKVRSSHIHEK